MAELPFGDNPFSSKAKPSSNTNAAPSTTVQPIPKAPPLSIPRHKKRTHHTINDDAGKGDALKKSKHVQIDSPSTASVLFGDIAKENFKDEDVVLWSRRGKEEAKFCFKQALGESFFHGLDLLNSMESENLKLQHSLNNSKTSSDYYKRLLNGAEKKIEELRENHKAELKLIQDDLDKVKSDAKTAIEAQAKEISNLKDEKASLQEGNDKALSDAFSLGFTAYLQNFLAADPEYDWTSHFPPSTSAYMVRFKEDNVAAIMVAKEKLEAKFASEKAAKARKEEDRGEDTENVSPSNTVVS